MKYPYTIFFRHSKYSYIDDILMKNNKKLDCSIFFTSDAKDLNKLFDSNYQILITFGEFESEYTEHVMSVISERMKDRWIHLKEIISVEDFNEKVNNCYIYNCSYNRENTRPIFSVFTPAYNSYHKIERAYISLKNQTFKDWEFIVIDDSPTDDHFNFLRNLMGNDSRVRLYRKSENNGNIGNLKNEAVALCRGKYVLEFDHDDEILPFVLQDSVDYFDKNSDVGFIYMDCIAIYENGNNFFYGDFICKGYGGYYCQKYNNKWVNVYNTPNINNITLSHLVCCPNHPRIWRKSSLIEAGNFCEFLPICDDYEIILRTAITTKIAKIHKFGYVQYMNDNGNNFSFIRNGEINRIGPKYINPIYYDRFNINEQMKKLDAYESEEFINNHSKIWEREHDYEHKYCNEIVNVDYDSQYCILGLDSLVYNMDRIKELYENKRNDFIVLENKSSVEYLQQKLDSLGLDKMKCYSLLNSSKQQLTNYFKMIYKSASNYEIIDVDICLPKFNSDYSERYQLINSLTKISDKYLEIGLEYGHTFNNTHFTNKVGVDPDPKTTTNLDKIFKCNSDDYFQKYIEDSTFDVIFIDGMHQVEYIIKDINNAIKCLNEKGKLFIDDIMPFNFNEQLKIPVKHYYENDILKYGEPWTGDVWKIIYYLLTNFKDKITFNYYSNINYRGVAVIEINDFFQIYINELDTINSYEYFKDYNNYLNLIESIIQK